MPCGSEHDGYEEAEGHEFNAIFDYVGEAYRATTPRLSGPRPGLRARRRPLRQATPPSPGGVFFWPIDQFPPKTLRTRNRWTERQCRRGLPIHTRSAADRHGRLTCLPAPRYADSAMSLTRLQDHRFTLSRWPDGRPSNASIRSPVRCDSPRIQRYGFMPDDEGLSPGGTYDPPPTLGPHFPGSLSAPTGPVVSAWIQPADIRSPTYLMSAFSGFDSRPIRGRFPPRLLRGGHTIPYLPYVHLFQGSLKS
ncbi:hypothetical protein SAMN05216304_11395 [Bosea sp. OK403]|nr:hypothetical protein SAMN05216304_11395 [Bosea sp. OK403]